MVAIVAVDVTDVQTVVLVIVVLVVLVIVQETAALAVAMTVLEHVNKSVQVVAGVHVRAIAQEIALEHAEQTVWRAVLWETNKYKILYSKF